MQPQTEYRVVEAKWGKFLINPKDTYIGRSIEFYGEWCEAEISLLTQLVSRESHILDIGANIGTHTVPFAKMGMAVTAFEPQRLIFQMLCANIALNGLANVRAIHAGCGDARGFALMPSIDPSSEYNFGGIPLNAKSTGERVDVIAVDDLEVERCSLMKIDVEGMELAVLRGAEQTIRRCEPSIYLEADRPQNNGPVIEALAEMGYQMFWHVVPYYPRKSYFGEKPNIWSTDFPEVNILAVPQRLRVKVEGLYPVEGTDDTWQRASERCRILKDSPLQPVTSGQEAG